MKQSRSLLKAGYQLVRFLKKQERRHQPLMILTHDYPDPDAIASAYALHYLLVHAFHTRSKLVYGGIIGRVENRTMVRLLKIPIHRLQPSDLKIHKQICLVDTQPEFRNNSFPKNRKAFLVIDQHPSVKKKPAADFSIVDTECGATCVIVAEACLLLELDLPPSVATALAYGILSDTMNLYRVKRKDVIQTYLALLPQCDMRLLAKMQNPPRSQHFFETLSRGIHQAKVHRQFIFAHLGWVQNPDYVAQVADLLLTYQGMRFALCTGRLKGKLHISFRMKKTDSLEACDLLRSVLERGAAGGHGTIAGGSVQMGSPAKETTWVETEKILIQKILKKLKINPKGKATGYGTPFVF